MLRFGLCGPHDPMVWNFGFKPCGTSQALDAVFLNDLIFTVLVFLSKVSFMFIGVDHENLIA